MGNGNLPSTRKFAKEMNGLLEQKRDGIAAMLPEHMDVDRFIDVARTAIVTGGDELRKCSQDSVYMALRQCAAAGLLPDGDESAIIRYGSEAQWTPMVKGVIRQILRSPSVRSVITGVVRKGDDFEVIQGMNPDLRHKPTGVAPSEEDYDPTVQAAYAIVKFDDGRDPVVEVMRRPEIQKARKSSRAPDSPAWRRWYDQMARKSVLHRAAKFVDLAPEARRLMRADAAANWEDGGTPVPEGGTIEDKLAADAESDVGRLKGALREADGEEEQDDEGGSQEREPVEAESREETPAPEPDGDEGPDEEDAAGGRIYPDEDRAPDNLPAGVGLWQETPGSGWYRPFVIELAPGGVVEQEPPAEAFLTEKNMRMADAVSTACAWAADNGDGGTEDAAGDGAEEPAPPEEPEEPTPEAESSQADNFRKIISRMVEDEESGVDRQDMIDACDKLFGSSDDVPRTAAGFVDLGKLDAGRLGNLVEELLDRAGKEAEAFGLEE